MTCTCSSNNRARPHRVRRHTRLTATGRTTVGAYTRNRSLHDEKLKCDMTAGCAAEVTHIEDKGYIYCAHHAAARKSYGHRCRKLTAGEKKTLLRGETIARY